MCLFKSRPLSPILFWVAVSVSVAMSQDPWVIPSLSTQTTNDRVPGHWQRRLGKNRVGADRTTCRHIGSVCWAVWSPGKGPLLLCCGTLAWILGRDTDLGGGMNGWLKRLGLVAVCQCQLCAEVAMVVKGLTTDVHRHSAKWGSRPEPHEEPASRERTVQAF